MASESLKTKRKELRLRPINYRLKTPHLHRLEPLYLLSRKLSPFDIKQRFDIKTNRGGPRLLPGLLIDNNILKTFSAPPSHLQHGDKVAGRESA